MNGGGPVGGPGRQRRQLSNPHAFIYSGQARSEIPRGVTGVSVHPSVEEIGEKAFRYCSRLGTLELNDGLVRIGEGAFQGCKSLRRVRVPSSVVAIARDAFHNCHGLEAVELAEGTEEIAWGAFNGCKSLRRVRVPSTVKKLGDWAFGGCTRLEEAELPDGVGGIGNRAFKGCKSLRRVAIPSTAMVIRGGAFAGCESLTEAAIGEGVEEIEDKAFYNCSSLSRVSIPSSVRVISSGAFECCEGLREVELRDGRLEEIGGNAFSNCTSLTRVAVPPTVKTLSREAFCYCGQLEEVVFREGLVRIECGAFRFCSSLRHIKLPSTVRMIEKRAFAHCKLMNVDLGDGVEKIDASAFENCASLRNVALPPKAQALRGFEPGCHDLVKLFGSKEELDEALKSRFEGLPVHELCFCQSRVPSGETLGQIRAAIESLPSKSSQDTPNQNDNAQDCLGFTPLHILTCSTSQILDVYQIIVGHQPNSLTTEDRWGCIPLLYAIWGDAPQEIVQFLVSSLTTIHPNVSLNWDKMFETLCRARPSLETVRALTDIQQASFAKQSFDLEKAARELTVLCLSRLDFSRHWKAVMKAFDVPHTQALKRSLENMQRTFFPSGSVQSWRDLCEEFSGPMVGWWRPESRYESVKVFRFLMKCGIPDRWGRIGVRRWREDVKSSVERIPSFNVFKVQSHCDDIHGKLVKYEKEYSWLKNATDLLELSIWKHCFNTMIEMGNISQTAGDYLKMKNHCRINCRAAIVIQNVSQFLMDG